jgi:hypothetical protein
MAKKKATNSVSTVKLPDGRCKQTGRETLRRLRVHFQDSTLIDNSNYGQGQQNLDVCKSTINRDHWNLARNIINQSINQKLDRRQVILKSFKSAETDEIVLTLLQQGVEQLLPYLWNLPGIWIYSYDLEAG